MEKQRQVQKVVTAQPTIEGAGVHLKRVFGFQGVEGVDPFLMMDDFRSTDPNLYIKGFPWHPHRGIETITYMIAGNVEHGDSMGNKGVINAGDVQWMTAGSGIIHQEMPKGDDRGYMGGFQLWANLPAESKMMDPRYQEITSAQIPVVETDGGVQIRIICGEVDGKTGPVTDIVIDPEYLDVSVPANTGWQHPTPPGHTLLVYVIEGRAMFGAQDAVSVKNEQLALFDDGAQLTVKTEDKAARFLMISGRPIKEPIAWQGPIVMNTQQELELAFEEYQNGEFIKTKKK